MLFCKNIQIRKMFPKNQYIFIFIILSLGFGCASDSSKMCQREICETKVESGNQIFRFSFDGVNGILEKRDISGNDWVSGGEKPEVLGYAIVGVFGINNFGLSLNSLILESNFFCSDLAAVLVPLSLALCFFIIASIYS